MSDRDTYLQQARTLKTHGIRRGFRLLVERYLSDPDAKQYPSPLRWLWLLALRLGLRWPLAVPILSALLIAPAAVWAFGLPWWGAALALSSPLLWIVSRNVLQDSLVALLTVLALGLAVRGETVWLGLTLFALLGVKEVSPLVWPAVAVAWLGADNGWSGLGVAASAAALCWLAVTRVLIGGRMVDVVRSALSGHGTEYARQYQSGGPHRLLVDLVLLSIGPVWFSLTADVSVAGIAWAAWALLVTHGFASVNNVRTVLAVDIAVRAVAVLCVAAATGWWLALLLMLAFDALVIAATRKIYDPVTANLTAALGMSPSK